jgi:hypothetical protein
MHLRRIPLFTALFVMACGPSRENFYGEYVEILCEKMEECLDTEFETVFGYESIDACIDEGMEYDDDFSDMFVEEEDCEYDRAKAKACLSELRHVDCGDDEEDFILALTAAGKVCEYDEIWDCD